jgi:hypothetical protein
VRIIEQDAGFGAALREAKHERVHAITTTRETIARTKEWNRSEPIAGISTACGTLGRA